MSITSEILNSKSEIRKQFLILLHYYVLELEMAQYDLEQRTLAFAIAVRKFVGEATLYWIQDPDLKQLVRSSGSIGANYLEANDGSSRRDTKNRVLIARREAKETIYWLKLIITSSHLVQKQNELINEATEIMKILSAIARKL